MRRVISRTLALCAIFALAAGALRRRGSRAANQQPVRRHRQSHAAQSHSSGVGVRRRFRYPLAGTERRPAEGCRARGRRQRAIVPDGLARRCPGGHHRKGMLRFKPTTASPASVELRLQRPAESAPRVFRWQFALRNFSHGDRSGLRHDCRAGESRGQRRTRRRNLPFLLAALPQVIKADPEKYLAKSAPKAAAAAPQAASTPARCIRRSCGTRPETVRCAAWRWCRSQERGRPKTPSCEIDAPAVDRRRAVARCCACDGTDGRISRRLRLSPRLRGWIELALGTPVVLWVGWPILRNSGFRSRTGRSTCTA